MPPIFPPHGPRDDERYDSAENNVREYCRFCLEFCSSILERRPDQVEALKMAANSFTELGYYHDGLALDERLHDLLPDDSGVQYDLACSLALLGRLDESVVALSRAVAKGFHDDKHMAVDRDLAALHRDPRFLEILAAMRSRGREMR